MENQTEKPIVDATERNPYAISLSKVEIERIKKQAQNRGLPFSKYIRFLADKDIENFKEEFIDPAEHMKLQKNLDEKIGENEHLRENVVKKVDVLIQSIQKERQSFTKGSIGKRHMRKLQKKLEDIGDDYFDSKEYKKHVDDTIQDFEESQVLEKQWSAISDKNRGKIRELMEYENLDLVQAIKKCRNLNLIPEFKRMFR